MISIDARFDGTAIIPDQPVSLPLNAALTVQIEERPTGENKPANPSALAWLAKNALDDDSLPADLAAAHDHYLYGNRKPGY